MTRVIKHSPTDTEPIHTLFGLSYANFLVMHRTLLQSMPTEWQERFCALVYEYDDAFAHIEKADEYHVSAKGYDGKFTKDPVPFYDRGRAFVEPKVVK